MAPFEQLREILHSVYSLQDDSMDEPRIEERSYQTGNKENKHADRGFFGNNPSYLEDYASATPAATTSPALATPSSSIVYGSHTTQLPPSSVCHKQVLAIQR